MYQQPFPQYQMPAMPPAQPQQPIFVDGEPGMQAYQVSPGSVVPLFDKSGFTMWFKAMDGMGRVSSVRYHLTEEAEDVAATGVDAKLAAMEKEINELKEMIANANAVPDVREPAAVPRHVAAASDSSGS